MRPFDCAQDDNITKCPARSHGSGSGRECEKENIRSTRLVVMAEFGKLLIFLGAVLLVVGVVVLLLGRTNLPIGRLPGDIVYRGKNTTFYFPLVTSILLSVVLSVLLYVIGKFRK